METWNPGYWKINKDGFGETFIAYEKRWFCNENKVIHASIKQKQNCKYCKEQ